MTSPTAPTAPPTRRIVALGGGGFSDDPTDTLLDDHLLALTGRERPRVCFVPTASGDAEGYVEKFLRAFPAERADASVLRLFAREHSDLRSVVLAQDLVYVGGGSTANLLAVWRTHGLDAVLREAYDAGVVLAGISAGMNCWFEASITDSFGPGLAPLSDGLGLLPGSACPHYDGEVDREAAFRGAIAAGFPEGYAADDDVALVFEDGVLREAVSSRPGARGYVVRRAPAGVQQTELPTRLLVGPSYSEPPSSSDTES